MKRSEINAIIRENKELCRKGHFYLPAWADWTPADWATKGKECSEIKDNCMGWDITDFGSGDFKKIGLSLITLRNGNPEKDRKPYCEKIMMVRPGQVTPTHFHWNKMEDIIFREGDGDFCMKLWNANPETEELIPDGVVKLKVDGVVTEGARAVARHLSAGHACSSCFAWGSEPKVSHGIYCCMNHTWQKERTC